MPKIRENALNFYTNLTQEYGYFTLWFPFKYLEAFKEIFSYDERTWNSSTKLWCLSVEPETVKKLEVFVTSLSLAISDEAKDAIKFLTSPEGEKAYEKRIELAIEANKRRAEQHGFTKPLSNFGRRKKPSKKKKIDLTR